jgi:putative transcriptional regulator
VTARADAGPARPSGDGPDETDAIQVRLDDLLAGRGMTLTELADRVGITIVNLSILKNGRARAIRFSTLARLCEVLRCQPGDLLAYRKQSGKMS